jgi:hypothetical protein
MTKKVRLVFDTETYGLKPDNIVFDIAWIVFNKKEQLTTRNYLVKETYQPNSLKSLPFYGETKVAKYRTIEKTAEILNWTDILTTLWNDLKEFSVSEVIAYNLPFDLEALQRTNEYIRQREFRIFNGLQLTDLYSVFCNFVKNRKDYVRFCIENNFISNAGNILTNAEVAYRFLTSNPYHLEEHTALSDVQEELYIYQTIQAKKKRYQMEAVSMPWKTVDYNTSNMAKRRK